MATVVLQAAGAGLGLLAGLTGTGGGIFLTPLLLLMHWARTKAAAAVSVGAKCRSAITPVTLRFTSSGHGE